MVTSRPCMTGAQKIDQARLINKTLSKRSHSCRKCSRTSIAAATTSRSQIIEYRKGKFFVALGHEAETLDSKVLRLLTSPGYSTNPAGALKYDSISRFFVRYLTVPRTRPLHAPRYGRGLTSQCPGKRKSNVSGRYSALRFLCSGFTDMVDFEGATKEHGSDFHSTRGHAASL